MNNRIYKYEIKGSTISLPTNAEILKFDYQNEKWYIWALIDDEETNLETRSFQLLETGQKLMNNNLLIKPTYIGTTITHNDNYVLHMFEDSSI